MRFITDGKMNQILDQRKVWELKVRPLYFYTIM